MEIKEKITSNRSKRTVLSNQRIIHGAESDKPIPACIHLHQNRSRSQNRREICGPHVSVRIGLSDHIHVPERPNHRQGLHHCSEPSPLLIAPIRRYVQQVPIPRMVHRQQQAVQLLRIAALPRDVVGERRRAPGAVIHRRRERLARRESVVIRRAESRDERQEYQKRDERPREQGVQPFLLSSHPDLNAIPEREKPDEFIKKKIRKNQEKLQRMLRKEYKIRNRGTDFMDFFSNRSKLGQSLRRLHCFSS